MENNEKELTQAPAPAEAKESTETPVIDVPTVDVKSDNPATEEDKNVNDEKFNGQLIEGQPILKTKSILGPYILTFIYYLLLLAFVGCITVLPIYKFGEIVDGHGVLMSFTELNSVLQFVLSKIGEIKSLGGAGLEVVIDFISKYFGLAIYLIIFVVEIIFVLVKFIHALFGLLTCASRKHKIIDNFYFKHTKQNYRLGILKRSFAFYPIVILNLIFLLFTHLDYLVENNSIFKIIPNLFDSLQNANPFNIGIFITLGILVLLIVFKYLSAFFVGLLSKDVKYTYVASKRQIKKAMKKAKKAESKEK